MSTTTASTTAVSASAGPASSSSARKHRVMTAPISQIFRLLQSQVKCTIMLYENTKLRIEGIIIGFDEYMNLVLDSAAEIDLKHDNNRTELGRIMLKGDSITAIYHTPETNNTNNTSSSKTESKTNSK